MLWHMECWEGKGVWQGKNCMMCQDMTSQVGRPGVPSKAREA